MIVPLDSTKRKACGSANTEMPSQVSPLSPEYYHSNHSTQGKRTIQNIAPSVVATIALSRRTVAGARRFSRLT